MATPEKACGYEPEGPYVEMDASRLFSQSELAIKAAKVCGKDVQGKSLALFKPYARVIIPDSELLVRGTRKPWSLGAYLARLRKAAGSLKFGVGIVNTGKQ